MSSTTTPTEANHGIEASPVLDLDTRMALTEAAVAARLDVAAVAYEVNAAHIDTAPVDVADVIRGPVNALPAPVTPYPTPVAALLQRAHHRLGTRGWCTGRLVNPDGAHCLRGAIRAEASGDTGLEEKALDILLTAIRRRFHAESVEDWNDARHDARLPLRTLDAAAVLADARGL